MLEFYKDKHEYKLDGVVVPNVTSIIACINIDMFKRTNPAAMDAGAALGTKVHLACTDYDLDPTMNGIPAECRPYIQAYADFKKHNQVEWTQYEKAFAMKDGSFAGTIDRYGILNDSMTLVDIKSNKRESHKSWDVQTFGYKELMLDNGYHVERRATLHLRDNGTWKLQYYDQDRSDVFNACLIVHRYARSKQE